MWLIPISLLRSMADSKFLGLRLGCCCLHFNINTNACMSDHMSQALGIVTPFSIPAFTYVDIFFACNYLGLFVFFVHEVASFQ